MLTSPPFKLASFNETVAPRAAFKRFEPDRCCQGDCLAEAEASPVSGRTRLGELDPLLHCSVLGTCFSTSELRKLMTRFLHMDKASDLDVHHEAVRLTSQDARVAKALHKALDKRHEAFVHRFSRTRDIQELGSLWEDALRSGEIPGAYWAVLTHRSTSGDLRERVFGDVHMLSHLVGAANRADIRRLVALEKDLAEMHDRLERQQTRSQSLLDERDAALAQLQRLVADEAAKQVVVDAPRPPDADAEALRSMLAVQTIRRERAEAEAAAASSDSQRLRDELDHLRDAMHTLGRELAAAEVQLRERSERDEAGDESENALAPRLRDRRILYVGGRPSSTPAIRDLVQRHGGEFQKHDGGLECWRRPRIDPLVRVVPMSK